MTYDSWKATNPADNELGRANGKPVPYRCLDCQWSGKGSIAMAQHYWATGHSVKFADDPRFQPPATAKRTA